MMEFIPGVGAGSLLRSELLADGRSTRIGAIHQIDYGQAVVLTHDRWKFDAGGISQFSFLLATAQDVNDPRVDDDEVLLLRVEGTAPLSLERDLHAVREESLRTALSNNQDPSPSTVLDAELDPFTKNRVSFTGVRCKILGTFYEDDVDGQKVLEFGADVDNFYATSTYRVLKPIGDGLATIASYLKPTGRPVERVRIGAVRYSATRRRAKASKQADAAVEVNIRDFIGNKTALLGMTRMGKSNTAKIIIARTFAVSERQRASGGHPIGQLIFDPQGEYANPNTQDGTEIAAIGANHVRIFKFGADGSQPHVKPLSVNFFAENQIDAVQGLIANQLSGEESGYVKDFAGASYADDPANKFNPHPGRARMVLYGALIRAGFPVPSNFAARINISAALQLKVEQGIQGTKSVVGLGRNSFTQAGKSANLVTVAADEIEAVVDKIIQLREAGDTDAIDFTKDVRWKSVEPIFTTKSDKRNVRGWKNLNPLRPFHSPFTQQDPALEIYNELVDGRVVIVDLHVGAEAITKALSESITRRLLFKQTEVFTSGKEPPHIQVMLEEAHNLFSSDRYKDELDVWVKLAKEASKLNLGMTYATQEVSGVAHQVKANTANWVVAHLNNTTEVRELAKFYDFGAFSDAIIASEDRGYVRLKTLSSPYIVPVQIDRYDIALVNEARAAAGDSPLTLNGTAL
ncbi:helicase HerA domain-containing protein [Streptomyces fradiae]|uniref:helicase HerA domain-containing protein n=1 Tax=Streptomyces fradiae TaxID=1906 RepID=UPI003517302A